MVGVKGLQPRIVVGVNDSAASRDAVLWAAEEARIRRLSLIITHIARAAGDLGSGTWAADNGELSAAAAAASSREPGIAVGTQLLTGDVGDELIELSRTAAVLVVGVDRTRARATHGLSGPIEDRIIAHAGCPVVTVSHRLAISDPPFGHVVVGWTGGAHEPSILEAAATEADARAAALTVVTAAPDSGLTSGEGMSADAQLLRVNLGALTRSHPRLRVTVDRSSPDLAAELQRQSAEADLLLVGCEQSDNRWSIRIGGLARLMTRTAGCPVMLVPERTRADRDLRPAA